MKHEDNPNPERRPLRAAAVVLAILLAAPGVDAIARFASPPVVAGASEVGLDASFLTGAGDAYASLDRIEAAASADGADVPAAFSEEVGFLPDARDVRANDDGSVIGYTVPLDSATAFARLSERMEAAGWTAVPLGDVEGATFVKSEGSCTWALATCTQVGSATSVVTRCVIR